MNQRNPKRDGVQQISGLWVRTEHEQLQVWDEASEKWVDHDGTGLPAGKVLHLRTIRRASLPQ